MRTITRLRKWINRDDGQLFQVDNRSVGIVESIGLLTVVAALILWQLHSKTGLDGAWAIGVGLAGIFLVFIGEFCRRDNAA